MVLSRSKAFNLIALVEFVVTRMETYYQSRLVEFANGRLRTQQIMLERALVKCKAICSESIVMQNEHQFIVPGATKKKNKNYLVDVEFGTCTCREGMFGRFCKHIAAIYKYFSRAVPNLPACSSKDRYDIARLAYGSIAIPYSTRFYGEVEENFEFSNIVSLIFNLSIIYPIFPFYFRPNQRQPPLIESSIIIIPLWLKNLKETIMLMMIRHQVEVKVSINYRLCCDFSFS